MVLAWLSLPGHPAVTSFSVAKGESTAQIAARLKSAGFIRSQAIFRFDLRSSGLADKLQPGTYDLAGTATYREIIERLARGSVAAEEIVLRFIEGWNLRDFQLGLKQAGYPHWDTILEVSGQPIVGYRPYSQPWPDFSGEYPFLKGKPKELSLEGYLFPDTYRIFRDAAPEEVVGKLLANFQRRLAESGLDREITASGHDLPEVITLASILEKEVRTTEDRRLVSDIFWRRLEAGMPLQADSTVNYLTGKGDPSASAEDLESDSPYNTYANRGLPPGPICNPGLDAIQAAVRPLANDYWYFLTDGDGQAHYAVDFEQHKRNKARYLN